MDEIYLIPGKQISLPDQFLTGNVVGVSSMSDYSILNLQNLSSSLSEKRHHVFLGQNLGNHTFLLSAKLGEFYDMSAVANDPDIGEVTQRKLDSGHAHELAVYILKGLLSSALKTKQSEETRIALLEIQQNLGSQVYLCLQPIVTNLRLATGKPEPRIEPLYDKASGTQIAIAVYFRTDDILWVIDGQHRREAMKEVFEFLHNIQRTRKYPKKGLYECETGNLTASELSAWEAILTEARGNCTVLVEVHVGLDADKERQLFHDLNSKVKKVQVSLAMDFDTANPIISFIKTDLKNLGIRIANNIDKVDFLDSDNGRYSMKELVGINSHLFLNKTNVNKTSQDIYNSRLEYAKDFWNSVIKIPNFGSANARQLTIAAQPVVLKALAKLTYDFSDFGRHSDPELLRTLLKAIQGGIDFTHNNPMWRYYDLDQNSRSQLGLNSLADYLPETSSGNRDVGSFDSGTGWMRFGAKHNDIFPIIGDMIRWTLKFPNRHKKTSV